MNIKDYIHLYLGCRVRIIEDEVVTGVLEGIVEQNSFNTEYPCRVRIDRNDKNSLHYYFDYAEIKPILRPLNDMTEEEESEVCAHCLTSSIEHKDKWQSLIISDAKTTYFLLSKRFDLFGLIEAGLAIDATKL